MSRHQRERPQREAATAHWLDDFAHYHRRVLGLRPLFAGIPVRGPIGGKKIMRCFPGSPAVVRWPGRNLLARGPLSHGCRGVVFIIAGRSFIRDAATAQNRYISRDDDPRVIISVPG